MCASNKFEIKLCFFVQSTKYVRKRIAERQESGEFSELVRIACSCAFRHRANNDEKDTSPRRRDSPRVPPRCPRFFFLITSKIRFRCCLVF